MIFPPYLQPGDTIGIVCPAGQMEAARAQDCIDTLQAWGYRVRVGRTLGHAWHYFSGTDQERLDDLQAMLDDPEVKAVLCGRGGYGTSRIIDRLDFTAFRRAPKWVIGFSDVTVLHAHLYTFCGTASLHAPMAGAFQGEGAAGASVASLKAALEGGKAAYTVATHPANREGRAEALLVGGNLTLLAHLVGSVSDIPTDGVLLFIEDIGEYRYNLDRMLIQLQRAGKLEALAGLVVGGFTDLKDTVVPFGQSVEEMILEKVGAYGYPVCFGFPTSHHGDNYALKVGGRYRLDIQDAGVTLGEI
ncbi:MAG TPA: LD-carboxypeptidase [Dinghuibacter sp.]|uniref:S66 peptidase family protein n=1 Tax=Dinghuibacter sp. TaxID=2024697 RepID=UPI002C49DCF9|nr:LD-carboxypeptidase [Dinghuibacter sp.]HTJ11579.1 LD-carboxypeptidase [Dinghuibacter sp.]